ncbi:MAG: PQQ-binding-like beta-propeller repeat protein [Candidatus Delongbacteria bacterium]|nr:PQQ-binding-like beta-propeller repeat protein [Candidatus Delongbacteria bacterium]
MKIIFRVWLFLLCSVVITSALEIQMTLDDGTPACSLIGSWNSRTYGKAINGSAKYKRKGDGSAYAKWTTPITWPGAYQIEMNCINGKYADSAFFTIHTAQGDTTLIISQYTREEWVMMGTFDLADECWIKVTDSFLGAGNYVLADAIRLTYVQNTYDIRGQISFQDGNTQLPARLVLVSKGSRDPILNLILMPENREFSFSDVPDGDYEIIATAFGCDTLYHTGITVSGADIGGLNLTITPAAGPRYSVTGQVKLNDSLTGQYSAIALYPSNDTLVIGRDSVLHQGSYTFSNLPAGTYRLKFSAPHYLSDTTSLAAVTITNTSLNLDPVTLYRYIRYAWLTDSHIGSGNDAALVAAFNQIAAMKDELDFVIHTGDIAEKGLGSELTIYKNLVSACPITVWSVPGNHEAKWTESGLQDFKDLIGPTRYSFENQGFKFLGVNSGIPLRRDGAFDPADVIWMENELKQMENPDMPVVIAFHHPADYGSMFNYWQILDLAKRYRTVFVMVGHGHSNVTYDFEGLPGAMCRSTYADPAGFGIVTLSEKEITVQVCNSSTGSIAKPWYRVTTPSTRLPQIEFVNLTEKESISGTRSIQIRTSQAVTNAQFEIRFGSGVKQIMTGSGSDWQTELVTDTMDNGYHAIIVTVTDGQGRSLQATRGFYVENQLPRAVWKYQAQSWTMVKPACDGERVITGTEDGRIIALNLSDGKECWPPYRTGGSVFSSPLIHNQMVLAGSTDGKLYAIDLTNGQLLWTYDAGMPILSAPVIHDTLLFLGGKSGLCAISLNSHQQVWKSTKIGMVECKPAIIDSLIIAGSWDKTVKAFNLYTGNQIWSWNRNSSFYYAPASSWPALGIDRVFVVDPERYLSAISLSTGKTIWSSKTYEMYESVGISQDKTQVYGRSLDGNLYAFSATDSVQTLLWTSPIDYGWDNTTSMPINHKSIVFTGSKRGFAGAVKASTGEVLWKYWINHGYVNTPTPVSENQVLVTGLDGSVMLLEGNVSTPIQQDQQPDSDSHTQLPLTPYPNPFNQQVTLAYSLDQSQKVEISVYNVLGQAVYTFPSQIQPAGTHKLNWNGTDDQGQAVPSGLYLIRMATPEQNQISKIMLLK